MANLTIDQLPLAGAINLSADFIPFWNTAAGETQKASPSAMLGGALTGSGTIGRIPQWSGSNALTNSTLAKTGAGILTLDAASAFTLTVPKTGTVPVGTGTAGRVAEWVTDANTLQASTLAKTGAGILTLSASGAFTLTVPKTGTAVMGTGTVGRIAEWVTDANTVQSSTLAKTGAGVLTLDAASAFTLTVPATGTASLLGTAQTYSALKTFSAGLTFGGSTLGAYVEAGSWTPVITSSGTNPTVTYTSQQGNYTRIGNVVFYSATITIDTISGGTANTRISLPLTAGSLISSIGLCHTSGVDIPGTSTIDIWFRAETSQAFGTLGATVDDGPAIGIAPTAFSNGDFIRISGFYFV